MLSYFPEGTSSRKDLKGMYQNALHLGSILAFFFSVSPLRLCNRDHIADIGLYVDPTEGVSAQICKRPLVMSKFDPDNLIASNEVKARIAKTLKVDERAITFFSGAGDAFLLHLCGGVRTALVGNGCHGEYQKRNLGNSEGVPDHTALQRRHNQTGVRQGLRRHSTSTCAR